VTLLRDVPGGVTWPEADLRELAEALEGVPLALELVRARLHAVSPHDLALRLGDSLDVLSATGPDDPDRPDHHESMRATLDWSRSLLGEAGWHVLDAVGACRGPVELPLLEALATPGTDVVTGCGELAALALVRPVAGSRPTAYEVAGAVRAYARDVLASSDHADEVQDRHAAHALAVAAEAARDRTGPAQTDWLESLPHKHADLLAAHAHLVATGRPGDAAALLADVAWYWRTLEMTTDLLRLLPPVDVADALGVDARVALEVAGALARLTHDDLEGAAVALDRAAAVLPDVDPPTTLHARVAVARAEHAIRAGRPVDALSLADDAATVLRGHGETFEAAEALARSVIAAWHMGDLELALARTRRSLRLHREAGSAWGVASLSNNLAYLLALQGDLDTAERLSAEALARMPDMRTAAARADIVDTAAVVAMLRGDHHLALARLEETQRLLADAADRSTLPLVLARVAHVHADRGEPGAAARVAQQAITVAHELATDVALIYAADGAAVALAATGHRTAAAELAATTDGRRRGSWEDRLCTSLRDRSLRALGVAIAEPAVAPGDDGLAAHLDALVEEAGDLLDQP
jgi:tetratricopeptide (TPR) repeat protein